MRPSTGPHPEHTGSHSTNISGPTNWHRNKPHSWCQESSSARKHLWSRMLDVVYSQQHFVQHNRLYAQLLDLLPVNYICTITNVYIQASKATYIQFLKRPFTSSAQVLTFELCALTHNLFQHQEQLRFLVQTAKVYYFALKGHISYFVPRNHFYY